MLSQLHSPYTENAIVQAMTMVYFTGDNVSLDVCGNQCRVARLPGAPGSDRALSAGPGDTVTEAVRRRSEPMNFTAACYYAVRALVHLAAATDDRFVTSYVVAQACGIPNVYALKVLKPLASA